MNENEHEIDWADPVSVQTAFVAAFKHALPRLFAKHEKAGTLDLLLADLRDGKAAFAIDRSGTRLALEPSDAVPSSPN
jgi:hypothetical protein